MTTPRPYLFAPVPGRSLRAARRQVREMRRIGQAGADFGEAALSTFEQLLRSAPATGDALARQLGLSRSEVASHLRHLERHLFVARGRHSDELRAAVKAALERTGGQEFLANYVVARPDPLAGALA